mgnify:FL=1
MSLHDTAILMGIQIGALAIGAAMEAFSWLWKSRGRR